MRTHGWPPFLLALAILSILPMQANGGCTDSLRQCLDGCARGLADCRNTNYLCAVHNTNCKSKCEVQQRNFVRVGGHKKISDYARESIWSGYPEMKRAIDLINNDIDSGLIDYALFPLQEYYHTRGTPTSIRKIPRDDMGTPQYWLLLKIYGYDYDSYFHGTAYGTSDKRNRGVPTLPPGIGEWYFARGLTHRSSTNEGDLLGALYIGAVGDPRGAAPIGDGSYLTMPAVRDRVRKMLERGMHLPKRRKEAYKLGYIYETLCPQCAPRLPRRDFRARDGNLVDLSLGVLSRVVGKPYDTLYENVVGVGCEFPLQIRQAGRTAK